MHDLLLIGFDSAWTAHRQGALAGVLQRADGRRMSLGAPRAVNHAEAGDTIVEWQQQHAPAATWVFLDQPTIVPNASGQCPVEHIVCSVISRRRGGMQPAHTGRDSMFGMGAPIWPFLARLGDTRLPTDASGTGHVLETYPALTLISLGWTRDDARPVNRLPKYNPANRRTFSPRDWAFVAGRVADTLAARGLEDLAGHAHELSALPNPRKRDQDALDALLCLLVALEAGSGRPCLVIGDEQTGYVITPDCAALRTELERRCLATKRDPSRWLRTLRFDSH